MSLKVGIIGYGGFGRFLHRAWSAVDGAEVTDIADISPERVPAGIRTHVSWCDLLDSRVVDVVSIATPPASHAEIAIAALGRGIHALVEKPLATSLTDAESILDARNSSGCVATVNFMLRFNPIVQTIHDWCRSGAFGSLQRVVVENYAQDETLGPGHWFWDETISGGILVEHGVHFFDIVNGCTSATVTRVERRSWPRNTEMTDRVFALVEYGDGLVASHYHAFNRLDDFERTSIRFVFDAAQVECEGWIPMRGRVVALTNNRSRTAIGDLPNLAVTEEAPVNARRSSPLAVDTRDQSMIDAIVSADFSLDGSKEDAYVAALRALMTDVVTAIRNPNHTLSVTMENGIQALESALA